MQPKLLMMLLDTLLHFPFRRLDLLYKSVRSFPDLWMRRPNKALWVIDNLSLCLSNYLLYDLVLIPI